MNPPPDVTPGAEAADRPGVRLTAWTLAAGTAVSAACFVVGFVLALLGRPEEALDPLRVDLILASAVAFNPSGWSMLGVLAVMLTPALGLLASFVEVRERQPIAALVALGVLGVLGVATIVAIATG
jgi:hypothetical protein